MTENKTIGLEEYKKIVAGVLFKIDEICKQHGLKYIIAYGTLIGAMRHKGFIPWDDDIDILMPRKDYDKLAEIIMAGDYGLNFIRIEENKTTNYVFGKVCDTRTELHENNFRDVDGLGAFVDVFPVYYLPDDKEKREKIRKKYFNKLRLIQHSSRTGYEKSNSAMRNFKRFCAFAGTRFISTRKLIEKLNKKLIKFDENKTGCVGVPYFRGAYSPDVFERAISVEFEGGNVLAPENYDEILTAIYGDWRKLPPEEERVSRHSLDCRYKN